MKIFKKSVALILAICLCFCFVGCGAEEVYSDYDNFEPAGVYIVDLIGGTKFPTTIDDPEFAQTLFDKFDSLEINTDEEGEIDASYLYLRFYNEDQSTLVIFTIYENGSCCLGEEFEEFYKVVDGRQAYIDLCELYESYLAE